jgi:hypothetical protein
MFIEFMFPYLMEVGDRRHKLNMLYLLEFVYIVASTVIESLYLEIACRLLRISVSIVRPRPPGGAHRVGGQERSRFRRDVHPARDKGNPWRTILRAEYPRPNDSSRPLLILSLNSPALK